MKLSPIHLELVLMGRIYQINIMPDNRKLKMPDRNIRDYWWSTFFLDRYWIKIPKSPHGVYHYWSRQPGGLPRFVVRKRLQSTIGHDLQIGTIGLAMNPGGLQDNRCQPSLSPDLPDQLRWSGQDLAVVLFRNTAILFYFNRIAAPATCNGVQ